MMFFRDKKKRPSFHFDFNKNSPFLDENDVGIRKVILITKIGIKKELKETHDKIT